MSQTTTPMSTAFLKEDAPDRKVFVRPRAPLPPQVPNLVTPRGLALLQEEQRSLEAERSRVLAGHDDEHERVRQLAELNGRLAELLPRLASARLVDPRDQPPDEVRFGATVTLLAAGVARRLAVVGVDEARASEGRIAFTAPVARLLLGKKTGMQVTLPSAQGTQLLTVGSISYGPAENPGD